MNSLRNLRHPPPIKPELIETLQRAVRPLQSDEDADTIISWVGDASIVLLGEATHGTHEFYEWRAQLTRHLIEQRGFSAVAVEADWPDADQVNQFVQRSTAPENAAEVLRTFQRFPTWMWRNASVAQFATWLRDYNHGITRLRRRVGFFGLDLYSLHQSMRAVIDYLAQHDPEAARAARASYACFDQYGQETETYAWAAARIGNETCEEAVTRQLLALSRARTEDHAATDTAAADDFFSAAQNARLARNAERYYRTLFRGRVNSWNVRDEHMAETLDELRAHLRRRGQPPKIVVWAHNSHLGDARATEMADEGEWNLGQLTRERYGSEVKSIGFSTHSGEVFAASDWGEPGRVQRVKPGLADSYEDVFHRVGVPTFFLPLDRPSPAVEALSAPRLQRAIGVVYRPESERQSHYFHAALPMQFDAMIHLDVTRAVEPLGTRLPQPDEVADTYPSGI